jgi:predicted nucleic-acid-binding protein
MIAVDTNIIIRFLVRDDEIQAMAVYKRFSKAEKNGEAFFVPLVVVLEAIWVLESAYQKHRFQIVESFEEMLRMQIFRFERDDVIARMLSDAKTGQLDLADLLIAHSAHSSGCDVGITFDKGAAKHPFFKLLK